MDGVYIYSSVVAATFSRRWQFVRVNGWSRDVCAFDLNGIACYAASIHQRLSFSCRNRSILIASARLLSPLAPFSVLSTKLPPRRHILLRSRQTHTYCRTRNQNECGRISERSCTSSTLHFA